MKFIKLKAKGKNILLNVEHIVIIEENSDQSYNIYTNENLYSTGNGYGVVHHVDPVEMRKVFDIIGISL